MSVAVEEAEGKPEDIKGIVAPNGAGSEGASEDAPTAGGGGGDDVPPYKPPRLLLAAVIIMGIMLVVGVVFLVYTVIVRASHHDVVASRPVPAMTVVHGQDFTLRPVLSDEPESRLMVPARPGEWIQSVTARPDGALAVLLNSDQGSRIVLWAPERARVMAEFQLTGSAPRTAPQAQQSH
ncbi:hypothetical protein E3E12_05350 [Formicincola oecophyllae]|uniref:Uncharacterized protein n=1 Tax=Formicincola oecophyllae TaxID=2558361 RepID=A0A4Y6UAV5_9PROT|nr:hypothetical protein [Formicincola oecophyllae]QDH13708.1 hypothetical protein E3E12_05350 [Formicincola oecophyllae]